MTKKLPFELVSEHRCLCGEAPLWDNYYHRFYWIDIVKGEINCYMPDMKALKQFNVSQKIGTIALSEEHSLIAALKDGIYAVDFDKRQLEKMLDVEPDQPDNRYNDGKCDPAGRFWVGTMSDIGEIAKGSLYTLEQDGSYIKKLEGLSISNGLAWNLEYKKFYHIDTPTKQVIAYDYHHETGNINNGKPIIQFEDEEGVPDGMTIDTEGMLWIAHWNGGRVSRWNPHTSMKIAELFLPVSKVTSCAFGGNNMDDLYVTTAKVGLSSEELKLQPLAGATFVFRKIGVKGIPNTRFKRVNF